MQNLFFISTIVFVIGVNDISDAFHKATKKFPRIYFPDRDDWRSMPKIWGRMIIWFFGSVIGILVLMVIDSLLPD